VRSADWKLIGSFGTILGVLLLIGGLFAYFYEEQRWIFVVAPYRDMAAPLVIAGIVLLVVGYVSNARAREEKLRETLTKPPQPPVPSSVTKRFCTNCGTELAANTKYCPSCGQKTEA